MRKKAQNWRDGQTVEKKEGRSGKGQEAFKRTDAITDQSTASRDGSLTLYGWKDCKDYLESGIRRCIHTDGEGASRCYDSSPKARGGLAAYSTPSQKR